MFSYSIVQLRVISKIVTNSVVMTRYQISDPSEGGTYAGYWTIKVHEGGELESVHHLSPDVADTVFEGLRGVLEAQLEEAVDALGLDVGGGS